MPDENLCPVVAAYLRHTQSYWEKEGISGLYDEVFDQLDALRSYALTCPNDVSTQRLRAFFCLHRLFTTLSGSLGGSYKEELPLTRENIQGLIKFCMDVRTEEEVKMYTVQLDPRNKASIVALHSHETIISLTGVIIKASEYLRPRLLNQKPMGGMGRFLAQGLEEIRAPSDHFVSYGKTLVNVSAYNIGGLNHEYN